jgi:hypothetical protein
MSTFMSWEGGGDDSMVTTTFTTTVVASPHSQLSSVRIHRFCLVLEIALRQLARRTVPIHGWVVSSRSVVDPTSIMG